MKIHPYLIQLLLVLFLSSCTRAQPNQAQEPEVLQYTGFSKYQTGVYSSTPKVVKVDCQNCTATASVQQDCTFGATVRVTKDGVTNEENSVTYPEGQGTYSLTLVEGPTNSVGCKFSDAVFIVIFNEGGTVTELP